MFFQHSIVQYNKYLDCKVLRVYGLGAQKIVTHGRIQRGRVGWGGRGSAYVTIFHRVHHCLPI